MMVILQCDDEELYLTRPKGLLLYLILCSSFHLLI